MDRVCQALEVEAQEMEHRRVEIGDAHPVGDGFVAEFVGGAVDVAGLDAAAGEPAGEAARVVVAAVARFRDRQPAEFAAPHHKGLVQQTEPIQIGDQGRRRPVGPAQFSRRPVSRFVCWSQTKSMKT